MDLWYLSRSRRCSALAPSFTPEGTVIHPRGAAFRGPAQSSSSDYMGSRRMSGLRQPDRPRPDAPKVPFVCVLGQRKKQRGRKGEEGRCGDVCTYRQRRAILARITRKGTPEVNKRR